MPITRTASISPGSACSPSSPTYTWTGPSGFTANTAAINATVPGQYTASVRCASSPELCTTTNTTLVSCFNYVTFSSGSLTNITATSPTGTSINLNTQGGFSFPYNLITEAGADSLTSHLTAWLTLNGGGSAEVLLNKDGFTSYIAIQSPYNFLTAVGNFGTANFQVADCNTQNFSLTASGGVFTCSYGVTLSSFNFNSIINSSSVQACTTRTITPSGTGCGSPSSSEVCSNTVASPYMENGFFWRYENAPLNLGQSPDIVKFFTYTYFNGTTTVESTIQLWNSANTTANFLSGAFGSVIQSDLVYTGANGATVATALRRQIGNAISTTFGHVSGLNFVVNVSFGTETLSHAPGTTYTNHFFISFGQRHSPTQTWGGHNKVLNFGSNRIRLAKFNTLELTWAVTDTFIKQNQTTVNIPTNVCNEGDIVVTLPKQIFLGTNNNSNWNFIDASEPLAGSYTPFSTTCNFAQVSATPLNCTTPPSIVYEWRNPSNLIISNTQSQVILPVVSGTYTVTALCPSSRQWATANVTI